ncbi:MAG: hypothetical protein VXZ05_09220 [Pseudomonadota bacterium]|nr:hypothetical protein [Pseudomonadota bacterium]
MSAPVFVTAAGISAELHQAMMEARGLALTAKNARALAVRAGSRTVGFRAITDFIEELASNIISQSRIINNHAEALSNTAVNAWRTEQAYRRLAAICASDADHKASVEPQAQRCGQQLDELQTELQQGLRYLLDQLEESRKHMRTANLIATSSNVEAATAGDFREQLQVIADNIRATADRIGGHLNQASRLLNHNHRERQSA